MTYLERSTLCSTVFRTKMTPSLSSSSGKIGILSLLASPPSTFVVRSYASEANAEFVRENFVTPGLCLLPNALIAKSVCARISKLSRNLPIAMTAVLMDDTRRLNARSADVGHIRSVKSSARRAGMMDRQRKTLTGMLLFASQRNALGLQSEYVRKAWHQNRDDAIPRSCLYLQLRDFVCHEDHCAEIDQRIEGRIDDEDRSLWVRQAN